MSEKQEYLDKLRHSAAHLLAAAVLKHFPNAKPTIGPSIDNGFYYDFDFGDENFSENNLEKIENTMQEIVRDWQSFEKIEVSKEEALDKFKDNEYKSELINEFSEEGEQLTFYKSGEFTDLCRGGHVENPSRELKAFKLLSVAGAYWRGDEKNKMLTRIYGTAFDNPKDLRLHIQRLEEARKNDHKILGPQLDLFAFSDLVGAGLVMYTPKGTIIKNELKKAVLEASAEFGAQEVSIPHMAKIDLYKISGHAEKFEHELFHVKTHYKDEFVLKPVNCPHHTQIYASRPRSYRDLPIRYVESTQQHRDEKPGSMGGLNRTRSFEIDDGHTFCTVDQIEEEARNLVKTVEKFYKSLDMWGNHWISLSFRDPASPEKYIGEDADWEKAQNLLQKISDDMNLDGKVMEGEAALYGPKIDIMLKDALGNDRQLGTIQIDFAMPKRFGLTYTDSDGIEKTPVMIHRAILGSYGRFIANLIESTGGAFPVWLAPIQAIVLPVTDDQNDYAKSVVEKLKNANIRVELDDRSERLQAKIRDAQLQKIPYMLVVGGNEAEADSVAPRLRTGENVGMMKVDEFIEKIKEIVSSRSTELKL